MKKTMYRYRYMELAWAPKRRLFCKYFHEGRAEILNQSTLKPLGWEWFINDIFSLWGTTKLKIIKFIEQASKHHQTIKFTAEVSKTETTFLDTTVYKGERFRISARCMHLL